MCKVLEVIKNDVDYGRRLEMYNNKIQEVNRKEFLNYIKEDEVGLFVMTIEDEESLVTSKELVNIIKDIKILIINKFEGKIFGSLFDKSIKITNI